jgi:decaprenylphospho-beta-D-erythro-pentofuranosid-2-ulose 2-reductase
MTKNLDLPNLLTAQPAEVANKIFNSKKKNFVMTPFPWNVIMLIIKLIPEQLFISIKL